MSDFENDLMQRMKNSILDQVKKQEFVQVVYGDRKPIPKDFLDKLWATIDWNEVIQELKPELQRRICNAIMGNMETEVKTDVKNLMSVAGVREKLRIEIYPRLMTILNAEK